MLFNHDLVKSVSYPMIPTLSFACQLHLMEMNIFTTDACAFGPIFGPGHL